MAHGRSGNAAARHCCLRQQLDGRARHPDGVGVVRNQQGKFVGQHQCRAPYSMVGTGDIGIFRSEPDAAEQSGGGSPDECIVERRSRLAGHVHAYAVPRSSACGG